MVAARFAINWSWSSQRRTVEGLTTTRKDIQEWCNLNRGHKNIFSFRMRIQLLQFRLMLSARIFAHNIFAALKATFNREPIAISLDNVNIALCVRPAENQTARSTIDDETFAKHLGKYIRTYLERESRCEPGGFIPTAERQR